MNACCSALAVLLPFATFAAVGPWDADVSDFPRAAGEAGDSARILRAVEAAGKGGVVWFPKGEYAIDAMLVVTNGCSLWLHKSAHLKAVKEMPFILRWDFWPKGIPKPGEFNLFIRGGDFDGAGLAGCVNVMGRWKFTVSDATFRNGRGVGLQFGTSENPKGCEMVAYNLYCICDMPGLAGNVGFLSYVGDSHYTDMVIVDYTVGIRDMRWSNRYTRCHVWGGPVKKAGTTDPEYLSDSIAFDINGIDAVLEDCYADTAMIGYNVRRDARIFNCGYFNNWAFRMDNPVVFAHEGGSLIVTGGRFSKNSPNAVLYRRGEKAGRLIWRDNQPLNFTEAEMKGLNDELKKSGEADKAVENKAKLAG